VTIRDVAQDFGYGPPTGVAGAGEVFASSIVGFEGTYLAPNTIDTGALGAYLTELTQQDTLLTVSGLTFLVDRDIGGALKLVIDWTTAPVGGNSVDMQLVTSSDPSMQTGASVVLDLGVQPIATLTRGYRQIAALPRSASYQRYLGLQAVTQGLFFTAGAYIAWIGLDVDSEIIGYASSFKIK
jgi:hypothetical protein